ncbi:MAG: hypothetical protein WA988_13260 [Candidatus Nanopelagicales bacterium]
MTNNILEPVDGSVYASQISPHEGLAYVTVAGPDDDRPMILGFDLADLDALKAARKDLRQGIARLKQQPEPDPGAVLQIINAANNRDSFVHDRVEYRYDPNAGEWSAYRRVDIEDDVW